MLKPMKQIPKGVNAMNRNTIITIGRQYGSGGREIGQLLADKLDIPFYDKELLTMSAKASGMSEEVFENYDEKPTNSLLYSLSMGTYAMGNTSAAYINLPIHHKVFLAQFDTIKAIAEKDGGCVIVGRCADYALANYPHLVNVFIHADIKKRVKRIMERHSISAKEAEDMINRTDKKRANYYNFYTNKKWSAADSYHLSVDSGSVGIDGTAALILSFADLKEG